MRETARALAALGVGAEVSSELRPNLCGFDLVHVFGITQPAEALLQVRHARRAGVPVVISPVYQNLAEYDASGRYGIGAALHRLPPRAADGLKDVVRFATRALRRQTTSGWIGTSRSAQQLEILRACSVLLPNSTLEQAAIERDFGVTVPCVVVPNGVSERFSLGEATRFARKYGGARDFVLAVGVITSLKNQLRLIEAVRRTGFQLVLIGGRVATHAAYYRAVARAARASTRIVLLGPMSPDALADAYAAARVIALPSWFETCGMVGLEGALAGCRVAVTDRGYTSYYFGDEAQYCQPGDVYSIKRGIERAYEAEPPAKLVQRIQTNFTWTDAARQTAQAYHHALELC